MLVLNSYHQGMGWTDGQIAGVRVAIAEPDAVQFHIEYMDTKRLTDAAHLENLYRLFAHKYRTTRLSAIVSTDNDAYDFLRRHRDTLFPGVPVIFSGVNWFQDAQISKLSDFTGVVESADHAATVELMLRLHPGTRRIVAIMDSTTTGKALRGELEALAATPADFGTKLLRACTAKRFCLRRFRYSIQPVTKNSGMISEASMAKN